MKKEVDPTLIMESFYSRFLFCQNQKNPRETIQAQAFTLEGFGRFVIQK